MLLRRFWGARHELVSGGPPADAKVGALLRDACRALNAGKRFEQPQTEDISELMGQPRRRLASARSLAAAGNADESARVLLALALAIVTPVQGFALES